MLNLLSTKQLVLLTTGFILLSFTCGAPIVNTDAGDAATNISSCNCTDLDDQQSICASNGNTFQSHYELCLHNCQQNTSFTIKQYKECRNCTNYANNLRTAKSKGSMIAIVRRCIYRTETHEDLIAYPYLPECEVGADKNHIFKQRQWNYRCQLYWCATPDGDPISGTISEHKVDCKGICIVGNVSYKNGAVYVGECGVCQCVSGTVKCIKDYCDLEDSDNLNKLKQDILKLFLIQNQQSDVSALVSLLYIRRQKIDFHEEETTKVLNWKFSYYDKDSDDVLSVSDLEHFYDEVYSLIKTKSFRSQFDLLLDTDNTGTVSKDEFNNFLAHQDSDASGLIASGKRSVPNIGSS